jgi:hypothetical protein
MDEERKSKGLVTAGYESLGDRPAVLFPTVAGETQPLGRAIAVRKLLPRLAAIRIKHDILILPQAPLAVL